MPRRLGNPASFVDIVVAKDERLFFSKRDAASFFDTLEAPHVARPWFCFPPVPASLLCEELGISLDALTSLVGGFSLPHLDPRTLLFPSSTTWPMGFAWSSAVAQDTTVGALLSTGFCEENIVCDSHPFPYDQRELAVVATDDVIFIHRHHDDAIARLGQYDVAMEAHGIQKAVLKDVNALDTTTALGCELTSMPPEAHPDAKRVLSPWRALHDGCGSVVLHFITSSFLLLRGRV